MLVNIKYKKFVNTIYSKLQKDPNITKLVKQSFDSFRFKTMGVSTLLEINKSERSVCDIINIRAYCYNLDYEFNNDQRLYYLFNEINSICPAKIYYDSIKDIICAKARYHILDNDSVINYDDVYISIVETIASAVASWNKAEKIVKNILTDVNHEIDLNNEYITSILLND